MKSSILIVFLILFSIISNAQENTITIYGKVVDKFTQQPLPGANVLVVNTNFGASTDLNGKFKIRNLPPGEYQLRASILSYSSLKGLL